MPINNMISFLNQNGDGKKNLLAETREKQELQRWLRRELDEMERRITNDVLARLSIRADTKDAARAIEDVNKQLDKLEKHFEINKR